MNRRKFILETGTSLMLPAVLSACVGDDKPVPETCGGATELDHVLCRQDLFLNSAPSYVTAGMLIGVALGTGLAVAARFHPGAAVAAALGGALLGGSVAAVDLYIQYRIREANGDINQAKADVRRDINHDYQFSTIALADTFTVIDAMKSSLKNEDHSLLKNAALYGKAKTAKHKINLACRQIGGSNKIYIQTVPRFGMDGEDKIKQDIKESQKNTRRIQEVMSMADIVQMGDAYDL